MKQGHGCCIIIILILINSLLIATCSNLLKEARLLQQYPGGIIHGDEWVNKLITWSIVGMCVGSFQTIFLVVYFWFTRNLPDESTQLRNSRILFSIVQAVLIVLTLVAIIVPGIDQWPYSYQETDLVMYSAILFIVIYLVGLIATVRAVLVKPKIHSTNAI